MYTHFLLYVEENDANVNFNLCIPSLAKQQQVLPGILAARF